MVTLTSRLTFRESRQRRSCLRTKLRLGAPTLLGARTSSPRAVHGGETSSPAHTAAATCALRRGGEIAQSVGFPRLCPQAGNPRSLEVDGPKVSFVRSQDRICKGRHAAIWSIIIFTASSTSHRARRSGIASAHNPMDQLGPRHWPIVARALWGRDNLRRRRVSAVGASQCRDARTPPNRSTSDRNRCRQ